jgi:hypothetical protein
VDSLYHPSNGSVAQGAKSGIKLDLVGSFAGLDLLESFIDNVPMSRTLDAELEQSLDTDIERLPDTGTAAGNEDDGDVGVIGLHPREEFF